MYHLIVFLPFYSNYALGFLKDTKYVALCPITTNMIYQSSMNKKILFPPDCNIIIHDIQYFICMSVFYFTLHYVTTICQIGTDATVGLHRVLYHPTPRTPSVDGLWGTARGATYPWSPVSASGQRCHSNPVVRRAITNMEVCFGFAIHKEFYEKS